MRTWIVRAVREWPLGIAIVGILSLVFLPRIARFGSLSGDPDRRELDSLRRDLDGGDPAAAEARASAYLGRHPDSNDARVLFARAVLARVRAGSFPGAASLNRAWTLLSRTPGNDALRREVADALVEGGLVREGVAALRELKDPDLALSLVPALVTLAGLDPDLRHALLDEASARISEYRRTAPPERRVQGVLTQAQIWRESKRDGELLALLVAELAEAKTPGDRGLLQLERGRAYARLGRNMEAMAAFDEAALLIADPLMKGMASVHQAELFDLAGNPECLDVCRRVIAAESPAAPMAMIVAGVHELKSRPAPALDALRNGFAQIRRPRLIDAGGFDLARVLGVLRDAAARESDPDRLLRLASVYGEIGRLQPVSVRLGFDHAAILLRARRFEEAADRFLSIPGERERALRPAADACAEGGLHLRAAALYQEFVDLQPTANVAGLHLRALSLKRAGDAEGAKAGFEDYVSKAGPSGTFTGAALLEKASLQKDDDALATYDRILKAREVATSPARDDWARALLGRGRVLLRQGRAPEARKALEEYLERYAEGPAPSPASIEAARLLVAAAVEERQWKAALGRLRDLQSLSARIAEPDRAPYADLLKEARFVEGDVQLNLEDYAAAAKAYADAVRGVERPEDRLWGLIGRARALSRLERKDEARRDYSSARELFDRETALAGHGREYWEIALSALEREVR